MQDIPKDDDRRLVPRLRTFAQTVVAGELGSLRAPKPTRLRSSDFDEKLAEWKDDPSLGLAVDLMSSAVILGRPQDAEQIAWWTLLQKDALAPSIVVLAESCASPEFTEVRWRREALITAENLLRRARSSIRSVGADAMILVDMSYAYLVLGKRDSAERAIKAALGLAPDSRVVLRAAARVWDHLERPEVARGILLRSERSRHDPWLIAAEVALASRADRSPRLFKRGVELLGTGKFAPSHISELSGAIGTQLLLEGKKAKALSHFRSSLTNPTENAIAQAGWAQRRKLELEFDLEQWASRRPNEARAWAALTDGQWEVGISAVVGWLHDEPFSVRASRVGVFMASIVDDHDHQFDFAARAMQANSDLKICANNLAYAEINNGHLEKAERLLNRSRNLKEIDPGDEIAITATRGMLSMRRNRLEEGRIYYAAAIHAAKSAKSHKTAAWAAAFRAREERRIGSSEAPKAVQEFMELAIKLKGPVWDTFRKEFGTSPSDHIPLNQKMEKALSRIERED
jgi:tetratricopeptide (TPR) repeat protein